MRNPVVAIIGASKASDDILYMAEETGGLIACEGWNLVCGGGGGVMEAACRGFSLRRKESPGSRAVALGILPGEDPSWGNEYLDVAIPTGIGWARNAVITRSADAVIAIAGCSGTLSEIAYAWQMDKPIVALVPSGGWSARLAGERIDERRGDCVGSADSPREAVEQVRSAIAHLLEGKTKT